MSVASEDNMELNMVDLDEVKHLTIESEDEAVEKIRGQSPVVKAKEKEKMKPVTINGAENTVFRTKELVLKVEYNGDIRKKILPNSEITYDELLRQIGRIFKCETLSLNEKLCVKYKDEDGDMVRFDTDEELQVAVLSGKTLNLKVETSKDAVKISSSEISEELLEMKRSIDNLLAKLDKSQIVISPVPKERSTSQNLASSVATRELSDISKYVPATKFNNIVVQPKENPSVLGNPSPVGPPPSKEPERKLNQYPTNQNENSGNLFANGQSSSVNSHFIPQAPSVVSAPSPMHVSSASASGIFQQPGPGPATSGTKNMPPMGNFAPEYARPTATPPSATITSSTVHPTAHQVYQPVQGNPVNSYGVPPYNPTSVQPPTTPMNNYFTPPAPTQNVSGYQAAPPMIRAPVAQAPPPVVGLPSGPPLPNINHPGSVNPYARSTAPRFGM